MSTPLDARVVRTHQALRQAIIDLAADSPLESITVRAIAARAGIGYATFFRHYENKEALLADVADMLTQAFLAQVQPLVHEKDRRAAARSLCAFVEANLPIHRALIAGAAGETVRAGMLRQTQETISRSRPFAPAGPMDDLLLFHLVSAILNLLAWWLRNPDRVDADTMADMIERTVLTPIATMRRSRPGAQCVGPDVSPEAAAR